MTAEDLKQAITPLKERQSEPRPDRGPFVSRALLAFAQRERIEALLQSYLDTLVETVPELKPSRRFYEGAWVVGLSADLPHGKRFGKPYLAFTRVEFGIEISSEEGEVTVTCRSTVRNRDFETTRLSLATDAIDSGDLEAFIEQNCLAFARHYFDSPEPPDN